VPVKEYDQLFTNAVPANAVGITNPKEPIDKRFDFGLKKAN
jgi:hypothetical protein